MSRVPGDRREDLYIVLIVGAVALVVVLLVIGFVVHGNHACVSALQDFDARVGSLDPAAYNLPSVPDEENAAHWFLEAARVLSLDQEDRARLEDLILAGGERSSKRHSAAPVAVFEKNSTAIRLAEKGGQRNRSTYGVDYAPGMSANLPNPGDQSKLQRLLLARGVSALERGDRSTVLSSVQAIGSLANAHEAELSFIFLLLGVSDERAQLSLVRSLLAPPDLDASTCRTLSGYLVSQDTGKVFVRALGFEGASYSELYRSLFSRKPETFVIVPWFFRHYTLSGVLRTLIITADAFRKPYPEMLAYLNDNSRQLPFVQYRLGAEFLIDYHEIAGRVKRVMAERRLAGFALAIREQALAGRPYSSNLSDIPGADDPNPYSGTPLAANVRADGSLDLSFHMGEGAWKRACPGCDPEPAELEIVLPPTRRALTEPDERRVRHGLERPRPE